MARAIHVNTRSRPRRQPLGERAMLIARDFVSRPVFHRDADGNLMGNLSAAAVTVIAMAVIYIGGMELLSLAIAGAFF